jgi:hypothetical protein
MATKAKLKFETSYHLDSDGKTIHELKTYADGSSEYTDSLTLTDLRKCPVNEHFKKYRINRNGEIVIGSKIFIKGKGDRHGFRFFEKKGYNWEYHSQSNRLVVIGWYMG